MKQWIWVAIDGPAGSGKSTIAKLITSKLPNFIYLNTGAMYRALAYYFIENKIDFNFEQERKIALSKFDMEINNNDVFLINNGAKKDITSFIYNEKIAKYSSIISSFLDVRKKLIQIQQNIASKNNIVMDGRDIGTVVLPNAQYKFFLEASIQKRAERRYLQLIESGYQNINIESLIKEISDRDYNDSTREFGKLIKADDAILINTDNLNIDQCCEIILDYIKLN